MPNSMARRGALTLLKSNLRVNGDEIALVFRGKGGKEICRQFQFGATCRGNLRLLRTLPGPRLFQYRTPEDGEIRRATAKDVNIFLREIAGATSC